ncbi:MULTISPECIES: iron ABC transporter permease [unclassified Aureispira]|uniref:FecCD family ABC transporter permease n=1 Tax=unclassified Aureispira TaxID=2649989 RepID=UPI000696361C|nr:MULTISPECIES: iron ABC transporter permease [unclassified Aureispira]WMX13989.1 iron ABC transporter permease [Aureispira sp. CCB-E]
MKLNRVFMASTKAPISIVVKLSLLLLCTVFFSLCVGAYSISFQEMIHILGSWLTAKEVDESSVFLIGQIRLPRIMLGLLVGAALAISGAAIQVVFRNPLAEPGLIGISSGAMFLAAAFIVLKDYLPIDLGILGHYIGLSCASFLGGLLATAFVYNLSTQNGRTAVSVMLLAGVAMTALGGGLTGILIFYATEAQLRDITFWSFGSLSGANWGIVSLLAFIILLSMIGIIRSAKQLEIMQLGDQEASYLGVEVEKIKRRVVIWVVLMVGVCVAFTGLIGFVGLMVPHLVRIYFKETSFAKNVLYTGLLGAVLLSLADTVARTVVAPAELPIGILTALLGAPFFLWLLIKQKSVGY